MEHDLVVADHVLGGHDDGDVTVAAGRGEVAEPLRSEERPPALRVVVPVDVADHHRGVATSRAAVRSSGLAASPPCATSTTTSAGPGSASATTSRQQPSVTDVRALAGDLVGLHATDPATIYLAAATRMKTPGRAVKTLERALYEERTVVRTLGMRRTMFVVPLDLLPMIQAACTDPLVPGQRKRLVDMVEGAGFAKDGARWVRRVEDMAVAAFEARRVGDGAASSAKDVPDLRKQISLAEGKSYAGKVGVSTRVLFLLSTEQRVARGRPKGSWTSSQHTWEPMDAWFPEWRSVPARGRGAHRAGPALAAHVRAGDDRRRPVVDGMVAPEHEGRARGRRRGRGLARLRAGVGAAR